MKFDLEKLKSDLSTHAPQLIAVIPPVQRRMLVEAIDAVLAGDENALAAAGLVRDALLIAGGSISSEATERAHLRVVPDPEVA